MTSEQIKNAKCPQCEGKNIISLDGDGDEDIFMCLDDNYEDIKENFLK